MTPLHDLLCARIAQDGPISVATFMSECLLHPVHGYYTTQTPFGRAGDFITAPEISQMFGEMLGLCLAQCWIDRGCPAPFCLAELGPGRGTLMADIWRATRGVAGFHAAAQVTLVEASPALRRQQGEALPEAAPVWADRIEALPDLPLFLVANEFFDALPIRQFVRDDGGWRERQVGLSEGRLSFGLSPVMAMPALADRQAETRPGDLVETCPGAVGIVAHLAERIARHGGAAVILDYGDWRSLGDTLQAVQRHTSVPVLENPGTVDLTAHVAFEPLTRAAAGCDVSPMVPQGVFLERLGLTERARTLAQGLGKDQLEEHVAAHRRLTHPQEMGTLFKTLGITAKGSAPVPGLHSWP